MNKHAYLIIAHNQFYILEKLLLLLDDKRNDIYIHIDKKVKDFDFAYFSKLLTNANVTFIDRMSVNWGGYSLIKCEMNLLKTALKAGYQYYHLISGVDMPLKSQDEIHCFFDNHEGKEFIHFASQTKENEYRERCRYYYLLQEYYKKNVMIKILQKGLLCVQKLIRLDRVTKYQETVCMGANWFSISHELAKYLVEHENEIRKRYRFTACCDEVFVQTFVMNSKFKENVYLGIGEAGYESCLRYIDWKRGNPYVFRLEDYKDLMESEYLFARKFDVNIDKKIVDKIYRTLKDAR